MVSAAQATGLARRRLSLTGAIVTAGCNAGYKAAAGAAGVPVPVSNCFKAQVVSQCTAQVSSALGVRREVRRLSDVAGIMRSVINGCCGINRVPAAICAPAANAMVSAAQATGLARIRLSLTGAIVTAGCNAGYKAAAGAAGVPVPVSKLKLSVNVQLKFHLPLE